MDFNILSILILLILWFNFSLYSKVSPKIKNTLFFILSLSIILYVTYSIGYISLLYLFSSITVVSFIVIGFYINRIYIYLMALLFLSLTLLFLLIRLDEVAEIFAVNVYLLLLFGVLKDTLYEKIFKS